MLRWGNSASPGEAGAYRRARGLLRSLSVSLCELGTLSTLSCTLRSELGLETRVPQHYTLEGRGLADDGLLERDAVDPVRAVHRSAAVERVRFAAMKLFFPGIGASSMWRRQMRRHRVSAAASQGAAPMLRNTWRRLTLRCSGEE